MTQDLSPEYESYPPCHCPDCGPGPGYMDVLLFMGIQPDGYVCRACKGLYGRVNGELKRLGTVIG